jgi:hypothetical protein
MAQKGGVSQAGHGGHCRYRRLGRFHPRGQAWETMRYRAFQAQLAGHTIGETFGRAAQFLKMAAGNTPAVTGTSAHATR